MKKWRHLLIGGFSTLFALAVLLHPEISRRGISAGLASCSGSVLPSLFPVFVITNLWISMGYTQQISRLLQPVMQTLFHLPGNTAPVWLLGALGGYPAGAIACCKSYQQALITKQEAEYCLFFCCNAGPGFLVGLLGSQLFQSAAAGCLLWAVHLISSILLGVLFRPGRTGPGTACPRSASRLPFLAAIPDAVAAAVQTAVQVCGFLLFFSVAAAYLQALFPDNTPIAVLLLASMELTSGVPLLAGSPIALSGQFVAAAGLAGWGGLCVHMQTLAIVQKAGLSSIPYLLGKLAHGMVSAALAVLALPLLDKTVPGFSSGRPLEAALFLLPWVFLFLFMGKTFTGKKGQTSL